MAPSGAGERADRVMEKENRILWVATDVNQQTHAADQMFTYRLEPTFVRLCIGVVSIQMDSPPTYPLL